MAEAQPIIIKKVKKGGHGHHGGAWKIAYADFVTAMMAFFLLLWLISMTTPEQKKGIADYFAPTNVSHSQSGAGGAFGGTAYDDTGARMSGSATDAKAMTAPASPQKQGPMVAVRGGDQQKSGDHQTAPTEVSVTNSSQVDLKSTFDQSFQGAAASILQAWQAMPDITQYADNLVLEQTKEGLNIVIKDQEGKPMFAEGSKIPTDATIHAIAAIAPIIQRLPNQVAVAGFTAAATRYTNPSYGAWELSSDRANAIRKVLGQYGLTDDHVASVAGKGTADPLFVNDPYLAANNRVEITLLYQAPPVPPDLKP
jgi:chemotaxis protein MotB